MEGKYSYNNTCCERSSEGFPRKTHGKVTQVGREVVDDEDPCTPNSSNAPKHVDDTLSYEEQAWLESLELADNPVRFEEPPDEFSELLTRLANHDAYTV